MRFLLPIFFLIFLVAGYVQPNSPLAPLDPGLPATAFDGEAAAVVALAYVAEAEGDAPPPGPKPDVGKNCPICNDPAGACGVGKVGDGRICNPCSTCGGDGRIDRDDVEAKNQTISSSNPFEDWVPKRIVLHTDAENSVKWKIWWEETRPQLLSRGVEVFVQEEPAGSGIWLMLDWIRINDPKSIEIQNENSDSDFRPSYLSPRVWSGNAMALRRLQRG